MFSILKHHQSALSSLKVTYFWFAGFVVLFGLLLVLPPYFSPTTAQYEIAFQAPDHSDWSLVELEDQLGSLDELIQVLPVEESRQEDGDYIVTWRRNLHSRDLGPDPLEPLIRKSLSENRVAWSSGLTIHFIFETDWTRPTAPPLWLVVAVLLLAFFLWQRHYKNNIARPASNKVNLRGISLALLISIPLAPLVGLLIGWLSPATASSLPDFDWRDWSVLLSILLLIPLAEEVVFRGWLLERLSQVLSPGISLLISAALFSVVHPMGLVANLIFMIPGLIWGYLWLRYRSLLVCTVAHASYNTTAVAIVALQTA